MYMHSSGLFCQNISQKQGRIAAQLWVKESIIFTRGRRNILGQVVILVLEKDKVREIN
jgi:hypothetical protein